MSDFKMPGEHIYQGMVMNSTVPADVLDRVPDFDFRPDDVMINTYPKAGTTWLQQIVWLIENDIDIETANRIPILERSCFLEIHFGDGAAIDVLPDMKSPRLIKSHLPYDFFRKVTNQTDLGFKVVIGMRNLKDTLVSYYHFYQMNTTLGSFQGSFDEFFSLFKDKKLFYGDYFDHVLSWWRERDNPNFHFVMFEDMKEDPHREISKIATFLGKKLSESEMDLILGESSFKAMQANPMTNMQVLPFLNQDVSKFIRKGKVGDWQNYFSKEQAEYVDALSKEKLLPDGLVFNDMPASDKM